MHYISPEKLYRHHIAYIIVFQHYIYHCDAVYLGSGQRSMLSAFVT